MDWPRMFFAGAKAAALGSLIGTSIPSAITIVVGGMLMADGIAEGFLLMIMPFGVGLVIAGFGLFAFGVPLTLWLSKRGEESRGAYIGSGAAAGGLLTFLITLAVFGGEPLTALFFALFGAFTGAATGHFWWRFARREEVEEGADVIAQVFG